MFTRSQTCSSMVLEPRVARALPGNREEAYRAGITPRIRRGTQKSTIDGWELPAVKKLQATRRTRERRQFGSFGCRVAIWAFAARTLLLKNRAEHLHAYTSHRHEDVV